MPLLQPEWRDEQQYSRYPFADTASLLSDTGLSLPVDLFLDASLYPIGGQARTGITSIETGPREVRIHIGDAAQASRAVAEFDPLGPPDVLTLFDDLGRPAGTLVSTAVALAVFQTWGRGTHTFTTGTAEFAASCVSPLPELGVRGFLLETGELLTGDVWFVGDSGVVIREIDDTVRFDIVGDPLYARRLCGAFPEFFPAPSLLRTINDSGPDEYGRFSILAGSETSDTILRIFRSASDALTIELVGPPVAP